MSTSTMRYTLKAKIGSGGMAEIVLATAHGCEGFERLVVLKRIHADLARSPQFVRMFIDEAMISARLAHPNIVHVYDFGCADGLYYLAMEHVAGRDLRCVMKNRLRPPVPAVAAEIARQVCLGLDYAHNLSSLDGAPLNVVHRDVTPSNIMIGYDGTVKLLDFGVARSVDQGRRTKTQTGMIKGKMSYVAPEQLRGQPVDRRGDLFSLGAVLYELLTWERLFHADTDLETVKLILEKPVPPPSSANAAIPRTLDHIVLKALERDPQRRYQTAAEMADDLEAYLSSSPHSTSALRRLMRAVAGGSGAGAEGTSTDFGTVPFDASGGASSLHSAYGAMATRAPSSMRDAQGWRPVLRAAPLVMAAAALVLVLIGKTSAPPAAAPEVAPAEILSSQPNMSLSLDSVPQEYTVRLPGYEPATVKAIPDQDKPALVWLRASAPAPADRPASRRARNLVPRPLFPAKPAAQCLTDGTEALVFLQEDSAKKVVTARR